MHFGIDRWSPLLHAPTISGGAKNLYEGGGGGGGGGH